MNDDEIIEYLQSRGRIEPPLGLSESVMARVDAAPQTRSWFAALLPAAATILVATGAVAVALLVSRAPASFGPASSASVSASRAYPVVADDPRFALCSGTRLGKHVIAAFPFRAADYHLHFPAILRAPELEVDAEAFAVVFEKGYVPSSVRGGFVRGSLRPMTGHIVCAYVGQPPDGEPYFYANVDITGMRVESIASASATALPTATPHPSPTPISSSPAGYMAVDGLPFTVLSNKRADALFDEVETCVSRAGYTIRVPSWWYINRVARDRPACSWFAPQPFDGSIRPVVVKPPPPDGVWIVMEIVEGSAGYTTITPIYMSEKVTVGGYEGHRAEFGPSTLDEIESRPQYRGYWYVIPLGNSGATFIAQTDVDLADDYPLAKAVLDRIVASITFQPN